MYEAHAMSGDDAEKMSSMMGPGQVDASLRQTLQMLWMVMPAKKRNVEAIEQEFRRLVDRALRDFREDADSFGHAGG